MKTELIQSKIDAFRAAFTLSADQLLIAAQIYAGAIAEGGPDVRGLFHAAAPQITPATWRRMEAAGNGSLDPRLVLNGSAGAAALRRLPAPVQSVAINHGVDLLTDSGDILRVQVDNLQPEQVRQVLSFDHIRDPSEQRAWIEDNRKHKPLGKAVEEKATKRWTVNGRRVTISGPCVLTQVDLAHIMLEIG
jgi:hypothetical protein